MWREEKVLCNIERRAAVSNISSGKATQLASGPADMNGCHTAESGADDVTDVNGEKIPH